MTNNESKKEINYYKLPFLADEEKNQILMSQEGLWAKTNYPQPNWTETDKTSPSFIKNKPEKFISEQSDWNETNPEAQGFIINKPSLQDLQANWNETDSSKYGYIHNKPKMLEADWNAAEGDPGYIHNKPEALGADWNATEGEPGYIANKPEALGADWNASEGEPGYIANKPEAFEINAVQGNWNQTDSSKQDFIKNKPFGQYDLLINEGTYTAVPSMFNKEKCVIKGIVHFPDDVKEGDKYTIEFDNTCYEVVYKTYEISLKSEDKIIPVEATGMGNVLLGDYFGLSCEPQGNPEEDLPFYISEDGYVFVEEIKDYKLWGRKSNNIKTIDKQFLPPLQSNWSVLDTESLQYIIDKPFGKVPNIIDSNTYYFSSTSVSDIYEGDVEVRYIPERNSTVRVKWDNIRKDYTAREYAFDNPDPSNWRQIYIDGIGNPNLMILDGQKLITRTYLDSTESSASFFIDLTNKKVYANTNGSITMEAYLYNLETNEGNVKYLDSKYLNGYLLPRITKTANNQVMRAWNGSWSLAEMPHSDWSSTDFMSGAFIENKPFGQKEDILYLEGALTDTPITGTNLHSGFCGVFYDPSLIVPGKKYTLIIDEQTYFNCELYRTDGYIKTTGGYFFGNSALLQEVDGGKNFEKATPNNYDFLIFWFPNSSGATAESIYNYKNYQIILGAAYYRNKAAFTGRIQNQQYNILDGKYLPLDKSLTKRNYAAEAAAVGNLVTEFQSIIEEQNQIIAQLKNQIYNLSVRLDALDGGNNSTPEASVAGETLIVEGSESNEGLILTYGYVNGETLTFDASSGSAAVAKDELNVSGSVDTIDDTLNASGIVTIDGVWEV